MRKFVIILPRSTPEQQAILHRLFTTRAGWWHWSPEVWLLNFGSQFTTVEQLREEIRAALPSSFFLVFNLDNSQFTGWGPTEWQKWFGESWGL